MDTHHPDSRVVRPTPTDGSRDGNFPGENRHFCDSCESGFKMGGGGPSPLFLKPPGKIRDIDLVARVVCFL